MVNCSTGVRDLISLEFLKEIIWCCEISYLMDTTGSHVANAISYLLFELAIIGRYIMFFGKPRGLLIFSMVQYIMNTQQHNYMILPKSVTGHLPRIANRPSKPYVQHGQIMFGKHEGDWFRVELQPVSGASEPDCFGAHFVVHWLGDESCSRVMKMLFGKSTEFC